MNSKKKMIRIGWKVSDLSLNIASVRYRALLPIIALKNQNCQSTIFSGIDPRNLKGLNVLVLVKPTNSQDYSIAQTARALNIPIILDLCDNIFVDTYKNKLGGTPSSLFLSLATESAAIVVTTTALAEVLRQVIPCPPPIYIIPDGAESPTIFSEASSLIASARQRDQHRSNSKLIKIRRYVGYLRTASTRKLLTQMLTQKKSELLKTYKPSRATAKRAIIYLQQKLSNNLFQNHNSHSLKSEPQATTTALPLCREIVQPCPTTTPKNYSAIEQEKCKKILWFGNHGAPHAKFGMLDLLDIQRDLEKISDEFAAELIVVSNNRKKYEEYIKPFSIPSRYVEWSASSIEDQFKQADVVINPNSLDAFSRCKSANRTILALSRNIPVVATYSPALRELSECILLNDFYHGIKRYFTSPAEKTQHLIKAQAIIEEHFGEKIIAEKWRCALEAAVAQQTTHKLQQIDLVVFLNLITDVDLALPILQEARQRNLNCKVWCSSSLIEKSSRTVHKLRDEEWSFQIIPSELAALTPALFPKNTRSLLSIVETNLGPHCVARKVTDIANKLGIYTATLQHGFENVGLTYDDDLHSISKISFSSQRIYLWGPTTALHKNAALSTRKKCLSVGCPKPAKPAPADLTHLLNTHTPVIGVFENLHWHRYSDDYRDFFIKGIEKLAIEFPAITFLVKPHNAGMWLTSRHDGIISRAQNLIIADPKNPSWEIFTASQLLGNLAAVITTPSTVALDAARYNLPVAIVQHSLLLENYAPIYRICQEQDWFNFVTDALSETSKKSLVALAQTFATNALAGDSATSKIVDDLIKLGT